VTDRIPVSAPDLGDDELRNVVEAVRSSWISSTGPFVEEFERLFATECGTRTSIAVSNGTVALHLAMLAHETGPGDEVLVPSLTYVATANAVRYVGADPVFVDVDPSTWTLDPALIQEAITERTKGIIVVHLYGHPADMDAINEIANRHGLWVVEDAAEAFGATYKGRTVGALSSMGTWSFYGNKILTSGEGGALTVSDPELERRIRLLRGQGMDPQRRYYFPVVGYNYRLTNVACAMLVAQLGRVGEMVAQRRAIYDTYLSGLRGVPGISMQPVANWATVAPWLFGITVDAEQFGQSRDDLMRWLDRCGIETRPFFIPIHLLPPYVAARRGSSLAHTEQLGRTGMSLPTSSTLTRADAERVVDAVRQAAAP
jgi:perosamine synthetase